MRHKESDVRKAVEAVGFTLHRKETAKYKWQLKRENFKGAIGFVNLGQVVIYLIEVREKTLDWNRVHQDLETNKTYDF